MGNKASKPNSRKESKAEKKARKNSVKEKPARKLSKKPETPLSEEVPEEPEEPQLSPEEIARIERERQEEIERERKRQEELARIERERQEELARIERERQEELARLERIRQEELARLERLRQEELARRAKRARQRQRAVNELLSTERTYVRLLELCIEHFMIPLDPTTRGGSPSVSQTNSIRRTSMMSKSSAPNTPKSPPIAVVPSVTPHIPLNPSSNASIASTAPDANSSDPDASNPSNTSDANTNNPNNPNNSNSPPNSPKGSKIPSTPNSPTAGASADANASSGASGASGIAGAASALGAAKASVSAPVRASLAAPNLLPATIAFPNAHKMMSNKHHKLIFSDLKTIYALNQSFLQGLEAIIDGGNWDAEAARLSAPFEQFIPFFTMYQNYLNNYDAANACYTQYAQRSDFAQFENHARMLCDGLNLQSLIILPIQRLPRYKLLLGEIIKNTEEDHIDFASLQTCGERIGATAKRLNERMKEYELRAKVRKIEARFAAGTKSFVEAHRSFVKEGKLWKIDRKGSSVECVFFLFNDILVYAVEMNNAGGVSSVKDMIAFGVENVVGSGSSSNDTGGKGKKQAAGQGTKLRLKQEIPINSVFSVKDVEEDHKKFGKRGFEIHSSVKSFYVYAKDVPEKMAWLQSLQEVIDEQKSKIKNRSSNVDAAEQKIESELFAEPLLIPDDASDVCMRCKTTKFTALTRRHHCRYCGYIVCSKCGKYQLASRKDKTKVAKVVCNVCYEEYKDKYPKPNSSTAPVEAEDDSDVDESEAEDGGKRTAAVKKRTSIFQR